MFLKTVSAFLVVVLASMSSVALAADSGTPIASPSPTEYAHPEWLASAAWLNEHLDDTSVAIIALTPSKDFEKAHIPGAVQVDWPAFEITETSDQQVASWESDVEQTLTNLGIGVDQTIVVYDGGTFYAARLWWIFHLLGHTDARILNGGLEAWQDQKFSVETGASQPTAAPEPYVGKPDDAAIATIGEVEAAVKHQSATLVDARTTKEYAEGHIPGAINIPFIDNAQDIGPKYWKSADELKALYIDAGVAADQTVIPYCSTGVRSAATYFALGLIGYTDVHLFSGSFKEWSVDPSRPVTTGDQP